MERLDGASKRCWPTTSRWHWRNQTMLLHLGRRECQVTTTGTAQWLGGESIPTCILQSLQVGRGEVR